MAGNGGEPDHCPKAFKNWRPSNWNPSSGPKVWHKSQNEISDDNKDKQMQKPPIKGNKQCSIGASL